jgi:hypothetical protein
MEQPEPVFQHRPSHLFQIFRIPQQLDQKEEQNIFFQKVHLHPGHLNPIDDDEQHFWIRHFFIPNFGGFAESEFPHNRDSNVSEEEQVNE